MGLRRQDRATYATTVAMAHVPKMVLRPRLPLRAEYPRFFKHPEVLCTRIRGSARSALKEFGHGPYLRVSSVGALRALIAGLGECAELVFQIGDVVRSAERRVEEEWVCAGMYCCSLSLIKNI